MGWCARRAGGRRAPVHDQRGGRRVNDAGARLVAPFGYTDIRALQKSDRVLLPQGSTPQFCRRTNAIAVARSEINAAARDYPIVFSSADETSFLPVAVLGLRDGQNLFIDETQEWEGGRYVPAFVRRYPFCVARVEVEGAPQARRMVCVEEAYLDARGIALYDSAGNPTPQWQIRQRLLEEYEKDLEATARACAMIARLGLFSPFKFEVHNGDRRSLTLKGMYRVDQTRLEALKPANHKALVTRGLMSDIYAHFHSLENFGRLYTRAVERAAAEEGRRARTHRR
ncbi:MAG: SapC family protein [Burkholderiales bacterium]|nr:SapC family protein [Burkholderiales bacterium]